MPFELLKTCWIYIPVNSRLDLYIRCWIYRSRSVFINPRLDLHSPWVFINLRLDLYIPVGIYKFKAGFIYPIGIYKSEAGFIHPCRDMYNI